VRQLDRLLEVIADIAAGRYSNDIMELSGAHSDEPVRTIAEAMGLMMVKVEAREYRLEALVDELKGINDLIRRNTIATVTAMAKALAARDAYTEGHAERVGRIAGLLAAELGWCEKDRELVELAGLLHDIGKIGFPDALFLPHEGENPKEVVREITRHPTTGAEILRDLDFLGEAVSFIRCHHERPDGRGYPGHLKDAAIPMGARLIAVADAFDAITTDRPYQKARTPAEGLAILKAGAGSKWDRECVAAFERILPRIPVHAAARSAQGRLQCLWDQDRPDIVLGPGPPGGAKMRWLKPDVDFSRYHRLMLDRLVFFFAPDSAYKGMDPEELKELSDAFHQHMVDALKKSYPIARAPAADVLRLRFAVTDLRQNRPVLADLAANGSTGEGPTSSAWSGAGATAGELLAFDSLTGEVVAAAQDERTGLKEKFTKWGSAEDAFQFWAERIRTVLDQAHTLKGKPEEIPCVPAK
jgi:putative nucleotidyltransferase with HDIG domain